MSIIYEPPAVEELTQLPKLAIIALAARRARTVLPLLDGLFGFWETNPNVSLTGADIEAVVRLVERFASGAPVTAAEFQRAVADMKAFFRGAETEADVEVGNIINYALSAAVAASNTPANKEAVADHAWFSCIITDVLIGSIDEQDFVEDARADFDELLALARQQSWTDETPVPAEFVERLS